MNLRLIKVEVNWSWGFEKLRLIDVGVDRSWGWYKLRLIEVEVDWSWLWLKLRLIEVEVDWSWGWLKLRLIEVKVNLCCNLWNVFEVYSCRQITFILYDFLFSYFLILWYFGVIVSFFWAILGWFGGSKTVLWFTHVIEQLLFFSYSDFWLWLNFGVIF